MIDLDLKIKEWKMIEDYKVNKNSNVPLYFYQKYSEKICNIVFYKITSKFSSIPLERNDLFSLIWKSINLVLKELKPNIKKNILACFIKKSYQTSLREATKFLTNGHILLNNACSLESMIEDKKFIKYKNGAIYQQISYEKLREELIKKITFNLEGYDQKIIQKIIYLKSLGCSLREISIKLKIPENTIKNLFFVIKKIGKLLYEN